MPLTPSASSRGMPLGVAGAVAATRYAGATAAGAPVAGTFAVGDFVIDQSGALWVCTVAGTPGTWVSVGGGGGGAVTSVFGRTGAVVAAGGDYTAAQVTNAADKAAAGAQVFTGPVQAPDFVAAGLTGAVAASRYVGATAAGAPAAGTFAVGDFVIDQSGALWVCTVAGTPGTWVNVKAVSSVFGRLGAVVAAGGDYTAAQVTNAADKAAAGQQAFTGEVAAPDFAPSGLTGSVAASRYVGATASGAPVAGAHLVGDFVIDQSGTMWVCTVAGTPGTWVNVGAGGSSPTATNGTSALGADVAFSGLANTFVIGPSTGAIGAAGQVFLLIAQVQYTSGASAAQVTFRLTDGSTVFAEQQQNNGAAVTQFGYSLSAIVTLAGAATFTVRGAATISSSGGIIRAAAVNNSGGNVASRISWVRLA